MSHNSGRIVTLLILFILVNTLPAVPGSQREIVTGEPTGTRGTIVVNASGGGDYTHIQWAIDNASEGDTVYVESGVYRESLIISQESITLIGENRNLTIIDSPPLSDLQPAGLHCLEIQSRGCHIRELALINSSIGVFIDSANENWIEDCTIRDNGQGVVIFDGARNQINNNYIENNYCGIFVNHSSMNQISGNRFGANGFYLYEWSDANCDGIPDQWETGEDLDPLADFDADRLTNGEENLLGTNPKNPDSDGDGLCDGMEMKLGTNPTMKDTDNDGILDGDEVGKPFSIYILDSTSNSVIDNHFNQNEYVTIGLNRSNSNIIENNILFWYYFLVPHWVGIHLSDSSDNVISNNSCLKEEYMHSDGFHCPFPDDYGIGLYLNSNRNYINNNSCIGGEYGIIVSNSNENNIRENNCSNNSENGINIYNESESNNIINNSFYRNSDYGIYIDRNCNYNSIYFNNFYNWVYRIPQAFDNGTGNRWNNSHVGNYWSDLSESDDNNNGIYDHEYNIAGSVNARDFFPLTKPIYKLPPIADAGVNLTINSSHTLFFGGNGSWGLSSVSNYTWSFVYANATRRLYGPSSSFTFHIPGTYHVTLIVTDSIGRTDADTLTITVIDNVAPIANAGPDDTIEQYRTYRFNGNMSSDNTGIANYSWSFQYLGEWITLYGIAPSFTFNIPGVYSVVLTVTDTSSNLANDTMGLTVRNITKKQYVVVDASGNGDYLKIQEGIDNVRAGGTVYVKTGRYNENIIINNTINLVGAGREFVTIMGNGADHVVEIMSDWVNLSGFEITNGLNIDRDDGGSGICINPNYHTGNQYHVRDNHCRIENNSCVGNRYGVYAKYSHRNFIMNNILTSNHHGIFLEGDSNIVERNDCSHNTVGIELHGAYDSIIIDNTFNSNSRDGIKLDDSCFNTVTGNTCNNNGEMGISIGTADHWECEYNKIFMNICNNNTNGIRISGDSDHNQIADNLCDSNELYGIYFYGIKQKDWRYYDDRWITDYPEKTLIENNTCRDNDIGIYLTFSNYNDLMYNTFISNKRYGIHMDEDSNDNVIHHNDFFVEISSGSQAIDNGDDNSWDDGSEGNYWSDYSARYPGAARKGNTWDTPYEIEGGNSLDNFPLCNPNVHNPIDPTAVAGQDVDIELDGTVFFDSTGSSEYAGVANHTWTFMYDGKEITLTGPTADFTFETPGTYAVTLTVTDIWGNVGTDVVNVTVLPSSEDDDLGDDDGEDRETGKGAAMWIWLIGTFLVLGLIVMLVIFLRKERGEEEDPSGEDELGRVGMDDDAGKNG